MTQRQSQPFDRRRRARIPAVAKRSREQPEADESDAQPVGGGLDMLIYDPVESNCYHRGVDLGQPAAHTWPVPGPGDVPTGV